VGKKSKKARAMMTVQAFETITHALDVAGTTAATISVAAGTYSWETNGETFPLELMSSTSLLGQGSETTRLLGDTEDERIIKATHIDDLRVERLALVSRSLFSGGIWTDCCRRVVVRDCQLTGNSASCLSLHASSSGAEEGSIIIERCTATAGKEAWFSMNCESPRIRVDACVLTGLAYLKGRDATVEDSTFVDGGLALNASSAEVRRCSFYGGGISLEDGRNLIEKCKLIGGGIDGEIYYDHRGIWGETTIRDCLIADRPYESGLSGVSWTAWSAPPLPYTSAADGEARGDRFSLEMTNCTVVNNIYGVWCNGDFRYIAAPFHVKIADCRILDSQRSGINFWATEGVGDDVVRNCLISGNSGGGVYCCYADQLNVEGCTILDNGAGWTDSWGRYQPSWGGLRASSTSDVNVRNCILRNNKTELSGSSLSVRYCCVEGGYPGVGNIVGDPIFASGPLGDYYLSSAEAGEDADSPCIDAGSTSASIAGMNFFTTRTDGAFDTELVDIGYHYAATPPTIEASIGGGAIIAGAAEAPALGPGDRLRAQVAVGNDGWPIWVDFYAAFVAADGTVFYITPDGLTTDFTPYAIDVLLDEGLHFGPACIFEFTLNEHVIPGDYLFAAALSRAREPFRPIGSIASVQFRIM